ncbi:alpha/beta-hydrolase [Annulohypoxylon maeteangense]|uniref:alpha/beta-hydrolase n=1 Tax=Annulohypoxylon maeteangense TaxID=1927788 RepID=UPI002007572A|nr:alpha/beta-hydrolase [Annulohypoxylon maeteangense]KAI0885803.1 alpha/beta-hydrolase [Annulohypoxylon maeteangense]
MTSSILHPRRGHTHTIIWLHDRNTFAVEFFVKLFDCEAPQPEGLPIALPDLFPTVKWVFPQAPLLRADQSNIENMSQWFDLWSTGNPRARPELQEPGLRSSITQIMDLIRREPLPSHKIFLAGFGQGFATALSAFLTAGGLQFAGLIGLSSWLPPFAERHLHTSMYPVTDETPVFLAHSVDDRVVSISNGKLLRDTLRIHMGSVEWNKYTKGGHWINEDQGIDDIVTFLRANM